MVRALALLAVALAGLRAASPVAAQVSGTVMDAATREGVPYANVALVDSAGNVWAQVLTDSTGYFSVLPMTNDAVFDVQVIAMGYASVPVDPIRYDGTPVHRNIGILAQPLELEGVNVEVEGQDLRLMIFGFYERKERGYGHFIDPEDIAAVEAPGVTGILRGSPGVLVRGSYEVLFPRNWKPRTTGRMGVAQGLSGQGLTSGSWRERFCKPAVFVNGSPEWRHIDPETSSFSPSRSFNDFLPPKEDIIGMEVYQSLHSLPREMQIELERLGGGTNNGAVTSECGALLIWTRLDDLGTPPDARPPVRDGPAQADSAGVPPGDREVAFIRPVPAAVPASPSATVPLHSPGKRSVVYPPTPVSAGYLAPSPLSTRRPSAEACSPVSRGRGSAFPLDVPRLREHPRVSPPRAASEGECEESAT